MDGQPDAATRSARSPWKAGPTSRWRRRDSALASDQCPINNSVTHGTNCLLPLSPREREVLANASLGLSNGEIAERLHVTVHAVKFHLAAIYRKLGVANRTSASVLYLRAGEQRPSTAWKRTEVSD